MIKVDGYRAFHGTLRVTPDVPGYAPYEITGDCLYKPEHDCWYIQPEKGFSQSVPAGICEVIEDVSAADVAPVRHGYWKDVGGGYVACSECGEEHGWEDYRASYCEDCGCKMDKEAADG